MDYEEKYNKALERARKELQTCGSQDCDAARQIFRLFPELAESEDERIKKDLIGFFKDGEFLYHKKEEIVEWLEKQGEQKSAWDEEDSAMAFTLMRDVEQMSYISTEGKNERIKWLNSLDEKL